MNIYVMYAQSLMSLPITLHVWTLLSFYIFACQLNMPCSMTTVVISYNYSYRIFCTAMSTIYKIYVLTLFCKINGNGSF